MNLAPSPSNSWFETATGADSGATATHTAETDRLHIVTSVQGHTDADATISILDEDDNELWAVKIVTSTNGNGFSVYVPNVHDKTNGSGTAIKAKISASTASCSITMGGFSVP